MRADIALRAALGVESSEPETPGRSGRGPSSPTKVAATACGMGGGASSYSIVLRLRTLAAKHVGDVSDPALLSGESRVTSPTGAAESAIKISPADPDLVVAGTNGPLGGQRMHWSTDGGATWTQVNLPLGGTCCDPAVDWSSDGQFAYATALGNCGFFGCQV